MSTIKCIKSNKSSIVITHPEIMKFWDYTKNGGLNPENFTYGSQKKIYWKCSAADDHEWAASINSRSNNNRISTCPFCIGQRVCKSNCLTTTRPDLAKQWHPTKNGKLTPEQFVSQSSKSVWWKCPKANDHEWPAIISYRYNRSNCPFCENSKVCKSNCLATTNPDLAKQWHPAKNGNLTPFNITSGSSKRVWWQCSSADDHEWDIGVNQRLLYGCPCCSGVRVCKSNCLATKCPNLVKQWHPIKNGDKTALDFTYGSSKKVWWKCPVADDHEWHVSIGNRSNSKTGTNCPYCDGKKVCKSNCLMFVVPDLAKQWHPTKNGNLTPMDIVSCSGKRVWWHCEENHSWFVSPASRINDQKNICTNCPYCNESKGEKIIFNYLTQIKLNFKIQAKFNTCKYRRVLPFDFLVNLESKNQFLIEYQGTHHYEVVNWSGSLTEQKMQENLNIIQLRDRIKFNWAKDNNIPLFIIPYWDFDNIEVIIIDFISSL